MKIKVRYNYEPKQIHVYETRKNLPMYVEDGFYKFGNELAIKAESVVYIQSFSSF